MNKFLNNKTIRFIIRLLLDAIFCCISGALVGVYQLVMTYVLDLSNILFSTPSWSNILIAVSSLIILFPINYILIKFSPSIDGSGVPYLIKDLHEHRDIEYKKSLPSIYLNSYISSFYGVNLGSEGPSIVIAGKFSKLYQDITKDEDHLTNSIYACSGFGCAFLSPLAGIAYFVESNFKALKDIKIVIRLILVCLLSFYISSLINHHHLLSINAFDLHFSHIYIILFLIIFNPIVAMIFIKTLICFKTFVYHNSNNFFIKYRGLFLLALAIVISFTINYLSGAGNKILTLDYLNMPLYVLLGVLVYKIVMTSIYGSGGITGGLVLPSMTLGAITAQILLNIINKDILPSTSCYSLIILISMCMMFGCINGNPLTSSILVASTVFGCTYNVIDILIILPTVLVSNYLSYFICKIFNISGLYSKMNAIK